jgi:hypothetical protein
MLTTEQTEQNEYEPTAMIWTAGSSERDPLTYKVIGAYFGVYRAFVRT